MMLPPAVLRLRLLNVERRIKLWFPLVLLWPVVAAALLLGTPLAVLAAALRAAASAAGGLGGVAAVLRVASRAACRQASALPPARFRSG